MVDVAVVARQVVSEQPGGPVIAQAFDGEAVEPVPVAPARHILLPLPLDGIVAKIEIGPQVHLPVFRDPIGVEAPSRVELLLARLQLHAHPPGVNLEHPVVPRVADGFLQGALALIPLILDGQLRGYGRAQYIGNEAQFNHLVQAGTGFVPRRIAINSVD